VFYVDVKTEAVSTVLFNASTKLINTAISVISEEIFLEQASPVLIIEYGWCKHMLRLGRVAA